MEEIQKQISQLQNLVADLQTWQKPVLTFAEAAKFTGLSQSYLYKLTSAGKIPHYKPSGKLLFFKKEELQNWLLSNRQGNKSKNETLQSFKIGRRNGANHKDSRP